MKHQSWSLAHVFFVGNIEYNVVATDALSSNVYGKITVKQGQPLETYLTNPIMYGQNIEVSVTVVNVGIGLASAPVTEQFTVKHKGRNIVVSYMLRYVCVSLRVCVLTSKLI